MQFELKTFMVALRQKLGLIRPPNSMQHVRTRYLAPDWLTPLAYARLRALVNMIKSRRTTPLTTQSSLHKQTDCRDMEPIYISQTLNKKANGHELTKEEIDHYIKELVDGHVGTAQIGKTR